jgi:hypothetical protein
MQKNFRQFSTWDSNRWTLLYLYRRSNNCTTGCDDDGVQNIKLLSNVKPLLKLQRSQIWNKVLQRYKKKPVKILALKHLGNKLWLHTEGDESYLASNKFNMPHNYQWLQYRSLFDECNC